MGSAMLTSACMMEQAVSAPPPVASAEPATAALTDESQALLEWFNDTTIPLPAIYEGAQDGTKFYARNGTFRTSVTIWDIRRGELRPGGTTGTWSVRGNQVCERTLTINGRPADPSFRQETCVVAVPMGNQVRVSSPTGSAMITRVAR